MKRVVLACCVAGLALCVDEVNAQHDGHHMAHKVAQGVKLESSRHLHKSEYKLRLGPFNLPAKSDHMATAQALAKYWEVPFDGWLTAYHPAVVNEKGNSLPGRVLHHVAFWNTERSDFLCPNKQEHIFGAGGEMNDWPELPGSGYRVAKGDRIRISTMFHNPTATAYPRAYLEVHVEYQRDDAGGAPRKSVYPAWFDVKQCANSSYHLTAGRNTTTGEFTLGFTGVLLGVGGHMHDYGEQLVLTNASRNEEVAKLAAKLDPAGRILEMPIATFTDRGGYKLAQGEKIRVTATYNNRADKPLPDGAMGIVVGYFLPANDAAMAALRRPPAKPAKKDAVAANR